MAQDGQIAFEVPAKVPAPASRTVVSPATGNALRWSAFLCILAVTALWMGPYIWRADLVSEDAAQHVFWFWRFVDPSLLANDPAADYFGSTAVAPWGYRSLYALLVPALGPQLAGEVVAACLLALACVLAWMIGTSLPGRARELRGLVAVAATLALVSIPAPDLFSPMGFQRSFALPITLLAAWALVANKYTWVGIAWLLAALFYPVILPVLGLAGVVVFAVETLRSRRLPAAWAWNGIAGVAAIAIVLLNATPPDWVGPQVTLEQARAMPEFGSGGRLDLEAHSPNFWIRDHRYGIGWPAPVLGAFALAAWLAYRLGGRRAIPLAAWALAASGTVLWAIAHLTLFHLYLPNRHTRTAVAAFGIIAIASAACLLLERMIRRSPSRLAFTGRIAAIGAPVLVTLLFLPASIGLWRTPVDPHLERAYAAIAALPPGTLVAAHPDLADFISLRTGRSVLASSETALPFMPGYYARMKPRVAASMAAAYAPDWESLRAALEPYPVDVVLLGPPALRQHASKRQASPLATRPASAGPADERVLRGRPPSQLLMRSGDYLLVQVSDPAEGIVQASAATPRAGRVP